MKKKRDKDRLINKDLIPAEVLQAMQETEGPQVAFDAWLQNGAFIINKVSKTNWKLGDWLLNGEGLGYTDKGRGVRLPYEEAATLTGISYGALRNIVSVCRRFSPLSLRNYKLSFTHHLAAREVKDNDKVKECLNEAVLGNYSVSQFRARLIFLRLLVGPKHVNPESKSEEEKQIEENLRTLAQHWKMDTTKLRLEIYKKYLSSKPIKDELEKATALAEKRKELKTKRKERRAKGEKAILIKSFDDIFQPYEGEGGRVLDLTESQVAEQWKINTGREFTNEVYKFAMKNTLLGVHFSEAPFSEFR